MEFNKTSYVTSPHDKSVREQVRWSIHPSVTVMLLNTLATSVGVCDGAPLTAHSSSNQLQMYAFFDEVVLKSLWNQRLKQMYENKYMS